MGIFSWLSGSEKEPPPSTQSVGQLTARSSGELKEHLARAMRDKQLHSRVGARIERLIPSLSPELAMKAGMGTISKLVAAMMSGWSRADWERNIDAMLHNSPPMKFAPGEAHAVCRLVENELRRFFGWPIEIPDPTVSQDDAIYINADSAGIVWIMSRGEEKLAVVGAMLTSQFLIAMQSGWTAKALQRPDGSGRYEVNLKSCEIADQESKELARMMRATMRPADDNKMRAIMKQMDAMLAFFDGGRFRIDKAPDSLRSPADETLLVWRP